MLAAFAGDPLRRCASDRKSLSHVLRIRCVRCLMTVRTSAPPGFWLAAGSRPQAARCPHGRRAWARSRARRDAHSRRPSAGRRAPRRRSCRRRARFQHDDVEDIAVGRCDVCGELVGERLRKMPRIPSRRRILEPAQGRLRGKGRSAVWATTGGHLQRRIVAQRVVIDPVLIAAADAIDALGDHLTKLVMHPCRIAPVRQRSSQPRDDAGPLLGRPQQQQACVRGLVAPVEGNCELLALDGWQIEGKRRSVGHGCGVPLRRKHARLDNGLLRAFNDLRHSHPGVHQVRCMIRARHWRRDCDGFIEHRPLQPSSRWLRFVTLTSASGHKQSSDYCWTGYSKGRHKPMPHAEVDEINIGRYAELRLDRIMVVRHRL